MSPGLVFAELISSSGSFFHPNTNTARVAIEFSPTIFSNGDLPLTPTENVRPRLTSMRLPITTKTGSISIPLNHS